MAGANPQGKGLVPVLEAWHGAQPRAVEAKTGQRILSDYFTSLLVLSADFGFKPRPGVQYHLYLVEQRWQLSLIAPAEWGARLPGAYLGRCHLRPDMTWELEVCSGAEAKPEMVDALRAFHEGFVDLVNQQRYLEEGLPFYRSELPYYRRLAAAGLASSVSQSMALAGLEKRSGNAWLEGANRELLGAN